ncbi:MAG: phosphodiester glycosidase family protein [Firmicutes bacterium]|nr:phosphodiester glycosidase family protein [Bacillota bacterium]
MKKALSIIGKVFSFLGITLGMVFIALVLTITLICHGPSESAKELFATTILETGQLKFLANVFLSKDELQKIVDKNSLQDMDDEVDKNLINTEGNKEKELIEIHNVSGDGFEGTMMVVNDPSKISLATTYPWGEYGKELGVIVDEAGAIAGVNGGIYYSSGNKGGRPYGVTVSNGEIQDITLGWSGLYLIGFDENNLLRIISLEGMNKSAVEKMVKEEKIRDAISFQEESSDANNHFVKLIINGEKRELSGKGSGQNPRTAIGQRKDGSVLILVTDGRGKNGHLGATASDLIEIMAEYGAVNAANVDGGSSSSLYYNKKYLRTSVTFYYTNSSWRLPTAFVVKDN